MIIGMRRPLAAVSARHKRAKRGFTLTEIAIVLGIVGLILGAIWVAAAAVYNNLRVSKATTELLTIVQNVRALYATSSVVDPTADMTTIPFAGVAAGAATTYPQANVLPSDTITVTGGTYTVSNPWNGSINVVSGKSTNADDSFSVEFDLVPVGACVSLITSNTGPGRDPDIYGYAVAASGALAVGVDGTAANAITAPVAAGTATTKCNAPGGTTLNVAFEFKLK